MAASVISFYLMNCNSSPLKSDSHLPKTIFLFASKMMKNAFFISSKALFILKIFKFLSWIFGHLEKSGLIRT